MRSVRIAQFLVFSLSVLLASASNSHAQDQASTSSRIKRQNAVTLKPITPLAVKAPTAPVENPEQQPTPAVKTKPLPPVTTKKMQPAVSVLAQAKTVNPPATITPGRRTELLKQPMRIAQRPASNRTQLSNSSRRVPVAGAASTGFSAPQNPMRLSPYTAPPMLSNRVASLPSQQAQSNLVVSRNNLKSLKMSEISGVKFADPKKFLKAGNFKFSNPDKFIKEEAPNKVAKKKTTKKKTVKALLASSGKNVLRIQEKQGAQRSPSDVIEPLDSKSVLQESKKSAVGEQLADAAKEDSKLNLSEPQTYDESEYLTVSDVRAPINFNPFGGIVQNDTAGMIKESNPLFRPTVAGRSYSEISGLAFQPHFAGWTAHEFKHKPLYFEETNLERYGNQVKYQHWVSGAHFFASAVLIPYKMGQEPPGSCVTTLGHRRPGECVPYQIHRNPLSKKGLFLEALAILSMSL